MICEIAAGDGRRQTVPRVARSTLMEDLRAWVAACAAGGVAGLVALALLLATDTGGLDALMLHDADGWLALVLLAGAFAATFGMAAVGGALLQMAAPEEED